MAFSPPSPPTKRSDLCSMAVSKRDDEASAMAHCLFFKEMTLNKMVWNFWHQFLIRFSMLFQMVPFILLCMVAHLTITWLVETIPTANQRALCWWFLKLPWREKRKVPSERAMKIESETGVKSDTPFCLRLPIEKTNSEATGNRRPLLIYWHSLIMVSNV